MNQRALTLRESLLILGILSLGIAIFSFLALRLVNGHQSDGDAERMRRIFVSLSSYEEQFDGVPPGTLVPLGSQLLQRTDFLSDQDPYRQVHGTRFPTDPGIPSHHVDSPFRISFSYLWCFPESVRRHYRTWNQAAVDPSLGLIADEWTAQVQNLGAFNADVSGPVRRVNIDGSLMKTSDRGGPKRLGDAEDLFFRK